MPLPVYHLRRLLAATAILLTLTVAGMYFYARSKTRNVLKTIPGKIGYDIKQTAHGFQFSKSDGKRTLFTVQASDIKEFKLNGNAELHNVSIVLYGRDSSRFDQIYGDDFAYDPQTGDVTAKGDVQIDLVANPAGFVSPDQSAPRELKNPIHLKTRDLVFNRNTGDAATTARVEFRTPQGSGWALGARYTGKANSLTLASQIHIELSGPDAVIEADHGVISNEPREIVLDHLRVARSDGNLRANQAAFYLSPENHVERVLAVGDVATEVRNGGRASEHAAKDSAAESRIHGRADQAEFLFANNEDLLRTATLTGAVHFDQVGSQSVEGDAGRVILDFAGRNQLQRVHAAEGARLKEKSADATTTAGDVDNTAEYFELTSPEIDFMVEQGHILRHAVTSGAAQITIARAEGTSPVAAVGQKTVVTAGKFDANFTASDGANRLASIHGAPDARLVSSNPGQPDRISTSSSVDAVFLPQGGIDSITQTGNVAYTDNQTPDKRLQAWANQARYTPANQILVLTGDPRVGNGSMQTTANTIRINRSTGDALAEGDVKSSYSELKEQPNGALLASASPIHVTSDTMTAHSNPGVALYSGKARLWQDANVIEAPSLQFDRDRRFVTAQGTPTKPVQTILVQSEKPGVQSGGSGKSAETSPISITAQKLTYADSERKVHYEGRVAAKGNDFTASADTLDAYLLPRSQSSSGQPLATPGQLDRMIATGNVLIQQLNRRAEGQKLVYLAAEEKFVLTGGSPSIFDAEQGKITGVSLTFFKHDDRVLVEGAASTPVVTTTRVAH